jgi:hypothetical protein
MNSQMQRSSIVTPTAMPTSKHLKHTPGLSNALAAT